MNMNVTAIWEDFEKEAGSFDSLEECLVFIEDKYGMTEEEAQELVSSVANQAIEAYFDTKKLLKKKGAAYSAVLALFLNGVFFGMYLENYLKTA